MLLDSAPCTWTLRLAPGLWTLQPEPRSQISLPPMHFRESCPSLQHVLFSMAEELCRCLFLPRTRGSEFQIKVSRAGFSQTPFWAFRGSLPMPLGGLPLYTHPCLSLSSKDRSHPFNSCSLNRPLTDSWGFDIWGTQSNPKHSI